MKPRTRLKLSLLFICNLLLSPSYAPADRPGAFCANPRGTAPSLSFTLTTMWPGDMDRQCADEVRNAKQFGFTTIALVPTMAFDTQASPPRIVHGSGLNTGEVSRCLETIWQAGLDIVFQPHVDSQQMYQTGSHALWRGNFDLHPDATYESELFDEFTEWLTRHNSDIVAQKRNVDVIVAAELERSLNERPAEWLDFVQRYRQRLYNQGVGTRVRIGINPNWYPTTRLSPANCAAFRRVVQAVDFVAPSFYGDWSEQIDQGAGQIHERRASMMTMLSERSNSNGGCSIPELSELAFAIGEFGITAQQFRLDDPTRQITDELFLQRRQIFSNLLAWARTHENADHLAPHYLNLWALDHYDPVGVRMRSYGNVRPDPEIARMIREYTEWRCPGINLPR